MTKEEALKLALEALNHLHPTALTSFYTIGDRDKAITAIKEALAQPEQEIKQVAHVYLLDSKGWPKVGWDDGRGIKVGDKLYIITEST